MEKLLVVVFANVEVGGGLGVEVEDVVCGVEFRDGDEANGAVGGEGGEAGEEGGEGWGGGGGAGGGGGGCGFGWGGG